MIIACGMAGCSKQTTDSGRPSDATLPPAPSAACLPDSSTTRVSNIPFSTPLTTSFQYSGGRLTRAFESPTRYRLYSYDGGRLALVHAYQTTLLGIDSLFYNSNGSLMRLVSVGDPNSQIMRAHTRSDFYYSSSRLDSVRTTRTYGNNQVQTLMNIETQILTWTGANITSIRVTPGDSSAGLLWQYRYTPAANPGKFDPALGFTWGLEPSAIYRELPLVFSGQVIQGITPPNNSVTYRYNYVYVHDSFNRLRQLRFSDTNGETATWFHYPCP